MEQFADRREAGRVLARAVAHRVGRRPVQVLALPRGGVPVAFEVAQALGAPLDVYVVRKLGLPGHEELAMGAIASGGGVVLNPEVMGLGVSEAALARVVRREQQELSRREQLYRGSRPLPELAGRMVVLVDDGLATGSTMRAAVRGIRQERPASILVAVPVASPSAAELLAGEADGVVALLTPRSFEAVGQFYEDFAQTSDEEVRALLAAARAPVQTWEVSIPLGGGGWLGGRLGMPAGARGLVLFAHGSGSSRFSPRNRFVAEQLEAAGLGTLLADLLTEDEEQEEQPTHGRRFDIGLLGERLARLRQWVEETPAWSALPLGYFGSSTGAAAALVAAARAPERVSAVVSRGGRPDLADGALRAVRAPTLLVVGGEDRAVLALNRRALEALPGEKRLTVVPGATHLFEEPGALEEVARLAQAWFLEHLGAARAQGAPEPSAHP